METGEQGRPSAIATAPTAGDPTASPPPPLGDAVITPDPPVDFDYVAEAEVHALISDEERDHVHEHGLNHDFDHEHEHDHHDEGQEPDHVAETGVSLEDLKLKIIKQVRPRLRNCNCLCWRCLVNLN